MSPAWLMNIFLGCMSPELCEIYQLKSRLYEVMQLSELRYTIKTKAIFIKKVGFEIDDS